MNWLLSAAIDENTHALLLKINNSSVENILKALQETVTYQDCSDCNALHLISRLYDGEVFAALIDKIPAAELNSLVLKCNSWNANILQSALVYQRSNDGVLLLLNKLSPIVVNEAVKKSDVIGFSGLMAAASYQQETVLQRLFELITDETLQETMHCIDRDDRTQLSIFFHKLPSTIMLAVLQRVDKALLEEIIQKKNKAHWHGLHYAALYQEPAVIETLFNKLSAVVFSKLATVLNDEGCNYLHYLMSMGNTQIIEKLLEILPLKNLQEAIVQLDQKRWNPYAIAMRYLEPALALQLTNLLDNQTLNKALAEINNNGGHALANIIFTYNEALFLAVLPRIENAVLMRLLEHQDTAHWTLLITCAMYLSSTSLQALLDRTETRQLDQSLMLQIKDEGSRGWNLLNFVVRSHSSELMINLINKASQTALESAVSAVCQNDNARGWMALQQAFGRQSDEAIHCLLNKISDPILNKIIVPANSSSWTALHYAGYYASPQTMLTIIQRLTTEAINNVLPKVTTNQDFRGMTVLHVLLLNQPFEVITATCEKTSQNILDAIFAMRIIAGDYNGFNTLMLITKHHNNEVLQYFINKISPVILAQSLLVKTQTGCTALHFAARFLRAESVWALCGLLTDELFNQLIAEPADMIEIRNVTPLQLILSSQPPDLGYHLLQRVSSSALEKAVLIKTSMGFEPLSSILSLYDYATIQSVLNKLSDQALRAVLAGSHKHYYQMLIGNTSLTNETAQQVLAELQRRVG